jgi:predicted RNA binding protein YcfA (HicA-like mRNA interferase family)
MNRRKLLARLARGSVKNVAFTDLQNLVEGLGFELRRVSGSHHIYAHPEVQELVNLQDVRGQAQPYQIRQVLRLVEQYGLKLRDDQ